MAEIDDENFVKAWLSAFKRQTGLKALAKELDMEYVKVSQRASALRRAGVKLPTMPTAQQKQNTLTSDVAGLNELISKELGTEALKWRAR